MCQGMEQAKAPFARVNLQLRWRPDLEADLGLLEAEAEGPRRKRCLWQRALDPKSFAASWEMARTVWRLSDALLRVADYHVGTPVDSSCLARRPLCLSVRCWGCSSSSANGRRWWTSFGVRLTPLGTDVSWSLPTKRGVPWTPISRWPRARNPFAEPASSHWMDSAVGRLNRDSTNALALENRGRARLAAIPVLMRTFLCPVTFEQREAMPRLLTFGWFVSAIGHLPQRWSSSASPRTRIVIALFRRPWVAK